MMNSDKRASGQLSPTRIMGHLNACKSNRSPGKDLLSQGVAPPVPSALTSLTAGFGMGPGVSSSLNSPRDLSNDEL